LAVRFMFPASWSRTRRPTRRIYGPKSGGAVRARLKDRTAKCRLMALEAAVPMAQAIKRSIVAERQLTASIGIGSNKFLAKLGGDPQFRRSDGREVGQDGQECRIAQGAPRPGQRGHGTRLWLHLAQNSDHPLIGREAERPADPSPALPQHVANESPIGRHQSERVPTPRIGHGHG